MKLIVGLGNPGDEYKNSRHNIGFDVIDKIAEQINVQVDQINFDSFIYVGDDFILLKPLTYMNLSGVAVKKVMDFYKIQINNLLVICDDLDIKLGQAKIRISSSSGGHNGVGNIIDKLGTSDFYRLKIGIGRPENEKISSYVLSRFDKNEQKIINEVINKASEATLSFVYNDINYVVNYFNKKDE